MAQDTLLPRHVVLPQHHLEPGDAGLAVGRRQHRVRGEKSAPAERGRAPVAGENSSWRVLNNSPTLIFEIMMLCLPDEPHLPGELIPAGLGTGVSTKVRIFKK